MTFTYRWKLTDLENVPKKNIKVFSTFACGGGSSMGYKMAGFDVIGCLEIDPKINAIYKKNLNPKLNFCEDIRDFNKRKDLPEELFNLDILDGSPPCSSFSMAGNREKDWGKEKVFAEGQALQTLDDLFFHYLDTVNLLKPKIFIAENVKGLIQGNAKGYVFKIAEKIKSIGYEFQLFQLNAANMGVPQKRERVFFIGYKKELNLPKLKIVFNEKPISCEEAFEGINPLGKDFRDSINFKYWERCKPGEAFSKYHPTGSLFNLNKLHPKKVSNTIRHGGALPYHWKFPFEISLDACSNLQSFPSDYQHISKFILGMSVPPLMTYKIALEIEKQWNLGSKSHGKDIPLEIT